nr:MAG TPA: zinc-ribbon protein [Caudoviricetes sp.]
MPGRTSPGTKRKKVDSMIKTTAAIKAYKKCRTCGFTTTDDSICSCKRCKSYLYTYSGMYVPKIAKK